MRNVTKKFKIGDIFGTLDMPEGNGVYITRKRGRLFNIALEDPSSIYCLEFTLEDLKDLKMLLNSIDLNGAPITWTGEEMQ